MAEEEDDEQAQEAAPPPPVSRPPSLLRYLPLVLAILLLQTGLAYFAIDRYLFSDGSEQTGTEEGERPRVIPESNVPEASVDLGEVIVNARSDYARLLVTTEVVLAVAPDDAKSEIESDKVIDSVKDAVNYELSFATPEELSNRDGRDEVKQRIMKRVNDLLYEGQVVDVFFGKFILQAMPGYQGD